MPGGKFRTYCKRGHLMAVTRVTASNGKHFCGVCKAYYLRGSNRRASVYKYDHSVRGKEMLYRRALTPQGKEGRRNRKLKYKYGINEEQYQAMLKTQNNCCAICTVVFVESPRKPSIDHSHQSGKVRGILCGKCNRGLGHFNDSPILFLAAINYLREADGQ